MAKEKKENFSEKMARLETIVTKLESDNPDLEEAIALFENGVKLTKECDTILREAERKVEILLKDQHGSVISEEFDPALEEEEPEE